MVNQLQGFQLAPQQRRLWMLQRDGARYHALCTVLLEGELRAEQLRAALQRIVDRHQALRTTFQRLPGMKMPVQVVAERGEPAWEMVDLSELGGEEQDRRVEQLFDAQRREPFDLARGPLCRAALLALGDRRHLLLVSTPSLCADAWTLKNLAHELAQAYAAEVDGGELPDEVVQYLQFSEWQNELLQEEDAEAGRAYWSKRATPTPLALPFEAAPGERDGFEPALLALPLDPDLAARIGALAQTQQSTVANVLLAGWQTLLWRLTGQPSIVVGAGSDGRAYDELYGAFGLFARWLPIQSRFERNLPFADVVRAVGEAAQEANEWQDYFIAERGAAAGESESNDPFFAFGFEYEQRPAEESAAGVSFSVYRQYSSIEPFKIKITCVQADSTLIVEFHYDSRLYSPEDVARLSRHYRELVAHAAADPSATVGALDILGAAERRRLLVELNATAADYPRDACLHHLFEQQAARTPDAIAIVFETNDERPTTNDQRRTTNDERGAGAAGKGGACPARTQYLTYRELDRRANQLAHYLRTRGVGPDVIAGIHMERSPELVIALLGVLKAGGAYLPLDLEYPPERLAFMVQDAGAPVLLVAFGERESGRAGDKEIQMLPFSPSPLLPFSGSVIDLVADGPAIACQPAHAPDAPVSPENLAYVIYTSGSTGAPKGTMITHRGVVNYLSWATRAYALAEGSGAPVHSPIGFDLTVTSLFGPLLAGQRALLLPEDQGIDALGTALAVERDLSLVKLTPSHLEIISGSAHADQIAGRARVMILGGEALWAEQIAFWRAHAPATRIVNEYGPTETVVGCCVYEVPAAAPAAGAIPIGRPIANTQLYILDANLQPAPVGVAGELYIGGAQLARGYLGRPDLTAERFVPNPFGMTNDKRQTTNEESDPSSFVLRPSSRLYRTGDLARYRPDDMIEYLGRIDQQVKLRGFRIELGEIEALLLQHAAVRECVVIAREDAPPASGPPERRLVAYLVLRPGQSASVSELRRFLQTRLPDYMLPSAFVLLAALPLTPNGKLDRRALPAPDSARPDLDSAMVAPRDEVEAALAAIWAAVLRLERVGIHDNFFALGGDSILSIQVIAKAHQAGIHLTPRQMFQHQTIAELAAVADTAPAVLAEQGLVVGPVPLTPIQRHFFEQNLPNPQHFNQALLLTTRRRLDPALLERALAALLAHHDALRLRFSHGEDGWQATNAACDRRRICAIISLARLPAGEQGPALSAAAGKIQRRLDLAEGPLMRAALFDLGADRAGRLLLVVHHLAIDGVSWRVLIDDLQQAYSQLEAGATIALPPKTTSYQQWARRLESYAQSEALRAERDYWRAFGAQPINRLPRDHPAGANTVASSAMLRAGLDAEETRALLSDVPAAYHTQINDALLTALVQAVGGWSGAARLLLDLEGHGREDLFEEIDLSRTIGWFTTIYPVLLELPRDGGPGAALQAVKEQLRAVPLRGIGYGVLRYLAADPEVQALPPAEIKFNYLGQVDQVVSADDGLFGGARESSGPTRDPRGRRTHVIEVTGITAGDQLWFEWSYSAELHERATIAALAERYLQALRDLIAHCLAPDAGGYTPSDFPEMSLTQAELDDLIAEL